MQPVRTYTITADDGLYMNNVILSSDGQSLALFYGPRGGDFLRSVVLRPDGDERIILSADLVSDRSLTLKIEYSGETPEAHIQMNLGAFTGAWDERVELTRDEEKDAENRAYAKRRANAARYGGGPMMCFTETRHDEYEAARNRKQCKK